MYEWAKMWEHLFLREVRNMFSSRSELLQTLVVFGSLALACVSGAAAMLLHYLGPIGIVLLISFSVGVGLILFAKLRAKRRGKSFFEWGPLSMTSTEKIYYLFGYILCSFALLSSLVIHLTGISHI